MCIFCNQDESQIVKLNNQLPTEILNANKYIIAVQMLTFQMVFTQRDE